MSELEQAAVESSFEDSQHEPSVQEPAEEQSAEVKEEKVETTPYYTQEEIQSLTPTDIDLERVPPEVRPIVENTIRDYKALQGDYTRKAQELAEQKKTEVYFKDQAENEAFKIYLENPTDYLTALSIDIAKYDSVLPDDGIEEYRAARRWVSYLNGVKDRFLAKRIEIAESRKAEEVTDAKIRAELGDNAQAILDYGRLKGFTEKELKTRPALLEMVKKDFILSNTNRIVQKKEIKPTPQKAATPTGGDTTGRGEEKIDTSKMTDTEWFKNYQQERLQKLKRKFGG